MSTGAHLDAIRKRTSLSFSSFAILPLMHSVFLVYQSNKFILIPGIEPVGVFWQLIFIFVLSCGLVYALFCCQFPEAQARFFLKIAGKPLVILTVMIITWAAINSLLNILQTINLNQPGNNIVIFVDVLNNVFSSDGLLYSSHIQADGSSLLGVHAQLIWFLIYPLFKIAPNIYWLIIITNVALALAVLPLFYLARSFFTPGLSLVISLFYLFNRIILAQPSVGDISEERFLPVLLISAFYFWHKKKYLPYIIFTLLAMTIREDVALVVMLFGILSLLKRRKLKWSLVPIILGISWVSTVMFWIIPSINPTGGATKTIQLYSSLGASNREIITTLFLKPWVVVKTTFSSLGRLAVIFGLWQSMGLGVPILSLSVIIALPAAAEIFLADTVISLNHFNMLALTAALMPALVLGLHNLNNFSIMRSGKSIAMTVAIIALFSTFALNYSWFSPSRYAPRYNYDSVNTALNHIPGETSVIMPKFMMVEAGSSLAVRGYYQVNYEIAATGGFLLNQDYIIIDALEYPENWKEHSQEIQGLEELKDLIAASSDYTLIYDNDDLKLYKRKQQD